MVSANGSTVIRVRDAVAVAAGFSESVTWTVKGYVPAGICKVPVIAPVEGSIERPGGSDSLAMDQAYGALPPSACSCKS